MRWNQRGGNLVLVVLIVAFIEVISRVGGSELGGILGAVAGVPGGFVLHTVVWLARERSTRIAAP